MTKNNTALLASVLAPRRRAKKPGIWHQMMDRNQDPQVEKMLDTITHHPYFGTLNMGRMFAMYYKIPQKGYSQRQRKLAKVEALKAVLTVLKEMEWQHDICEDATARMLNAQMEIPA